jgi:hypothetical protein
MSRELHPAALSLGQDGWRVLDVREGVAPTLVPDIAAIQISSRRFRH